MSYINEKTDKYKALLADVLEQVPYPEPDCSCHVAPPCQDCVENEGLRELLDDIRKALEE